MVASLTRSSLFRRGALLLTGLLLLAAAAAIAVDRTSAPIQAEPGSSTTTQEEIAYWTPEQGWREQVRERTERIVERQDGLALQGTLSGAFSPRGGAFTLPVDEGLEVTGEPGVRAGFPSTPLFGEIRDVVHLGVPWDNEHGLAVGAIDAFHRMGTEQRGGVTLIEYDARHVGQFLVTDGTIWYRATARTALVEPLTGMVVDYRDHETLWSEPVHGPLGETGLPLLGDLDERFTHRERVWASDVRPTPEASQALLERAIDARHDHLWDLALPILPALVAGELAIGMALVGRPERWLHP